MLNINEPQINVMKIIFYWQKMLLQLGSDHVIDDGEELIAHPLEGYIQLRGKERYFVGQSLWEPRGRLGLVVFADSPEHL